MNKLTKPISSIIKKFDLFPASQYLRYKGQTEHKTAAGGFISIATITICIILFYNLGIQTLSKQIIYGLTTNTVEIQPESLKINFGNASNFMFCFGIQYVNISDTSKKYFNITLKQNFYGPLQLTLINSTTVPLVMCTPQHFSYNKDTMDFYNKFYLSQALCPSMDYEFNIGGRLISEVFSYFAVYIQRCNKSIDANCASDEQLQAFQNKIGGFNLYIPIINSIVNPGDAQYKQTYVQERNYQFFTTKAGLWMNAEIQQYQIDTDVSLMPYNDIQSEYITAIPQLFLVKHRQVLNTNRFVELIFSKSSTSTLFTRSFNKIDTYFSYIGGLVGTLLLFFIFLGSYSDSSFIVSLASSIYRFEENGQGEPSIKFNFINYLQINLQDFLKLIHVKPKQGEITNLRRAIKQMEKELDIAYMLRRISFCEEALSSILNQQQIKTIYRKTKKSIKQAAIKRRMTKQRQKAAQSIHKLNKQIQPKANDSSNNVFNLEIEQNRAELNFQERGMSFIHKAAKMSRNKKLRNKILPMRFITRRRNIKEVKRSVEGSTERLSLKQMPQCRRILSINMHRVKSFSNFIGEKVRSNKSLALRQKNESWIHIF